MIPNNVDREKGFASNVVCLLPRRRVTSKGCDFMDKVLQVSGSFFCSNSILFLSNYFKKLTTSSASLYIFFLAAKKKDVKYFRLVKVT